MTKKRTISVTSIIAALSILLYFCGVQIFNDFKMTFENREVIISNLGYALEGVCEWTDEALSENSEGIAQAINQFNMARDSIIVLEQGLSHYTVLFGRTTFFQISAPFPASDFIDFAVIPRYEEIGKKLEENGELSEDDRYFLSEVSEGAKELLATFRNEDNSVKKEYYRKDLLLSSALDEFLERLYQF